MSHLKQQTQSDAYKILRIFHVISIHSDKRLTLGQTSSHNICWNSAFVSIFFDYYLYETSESQYNLIKSENSE